MAFIGGLSTTINKMAERNEHYRGLFLHAKDTARGDRIVSFLCREGLLSLFLFGGPKSSLRSAAMPFVAADIEVYRDTRRELLKLTGVNIMEIYDGVEISFSHMQAATSAAEFLLKTSAFGGEYICALESIINFLRELKKTDEQGARDLFLTFLWQALSPLGLAPDLIRCEQCGMPFAQTGALPGWLLTGAHSFVCASCGAQKHKEGFPLSAMLPFDDQIRHCLMALLSCTYADSLQVFAHCASRHQIASIIESLATSAAEGPLQSLTLFTKEFS